MGGRSELRCSSRVLGRASHGGSCGAGAERVGPACDAGEVSELAVVADDGTVGMIGAGVLVEGSRGPSRGLRSH